MAGKDKEEKETQEDEEEEEEAEEEEEEEEEAEMKSPKLYLIWKLDPGKNTFLVWKNIGN